MSELSNNSTRFKLGFHKGEIKLNPIDPLILLGLIFIGPIFIFFGLLYAILIILVKKPKN